MRQMIIDNKEIWNKACKGLELTEEEEIVRKMISSTWYLITVKCMNRQCT